jgi:hypothetical protein
MNWSFFLQTATLIEHFPQALSHGAIWNHPGWLDVGVLWKTNNDNPNPNPRYINLRL